MTATADLAFRARALAQAHPLTAVASRFVDRMVAIETDTQPDAHVASWAGSELVAGYCLRRVEESDACVQDRPDPEHSVAPEQLEQAAQKVAAALRAGDPAPYLLGDREDIFVALNAIIASEVESRLHNFREQMDPDACREFENYVTAWVVTGYAVRVAERELGLL